MSPSGYSGKPLWQKLGIKPSTRLMVFNAPEDYMELLGTDCTQQLVQSKPDLIHAFTDSQKTFFATMKKLEKMYRQNTRLIIWISWYKKSAAQKSDMTEDIIRNQALANGLVDVKVCSVSEDWSGLKLVVPLNKRYAE